MEIKGVRIQNETNYYRILSVIKNNENITVKEIEVLNSFLKGEETMEVSKNELLENKKTTNKVFSSIRGLMYKENYSFFS